MFLYYPFNPVTPACNPKATYWKVRKKDDRSYVVHRKYRSQRLLFLIDLWETPRKKSQTGTVTK